jgi:hypothetical protein
VGHGVDGVDGADEVNGAGDVVAAEAEPLDPGTWWGDGAAAVDGEMSGTGEAPSPGRTTSPDRAELDRLDGASEAGADDSPTARAGANGAERWSVMGAAGSMVTPAACATAMSDSALLREGLSSRWAPLSWARTRRAPPSQLHSA